MEEIITMVEGCDEKRRRQKWIQRKKEGRKMMVAMKHTRRNKAWLVEWNFESFWLLKCH